MASERILVSPGVFDREFDGTFRPADPRGVATAVISPRAKGPAFEPIFIKDLDEDEQIFGKPTSKGDDFGAYCARAFLRQESDPLVQVRLLGMSDTGVTPGYSVLSTYALVSSGSSVVALIQASGSTVIALQGTLSSSAAELAISITGQPSVTASLHRSSDKYISKVLNTDPSLLSTRRHVLFAVYDYAVKAPSAGSAFIMSNITPGVSSAWTDDFVTGATTTVISQPFSETEYGLFGIGNRMAGESANSEFKVSILGIKKSSNESVDPYGSFSLIVRDYSDNDKSPVVLESYSNLSLDRSNPNYVCRRIGDTYKVWNKTSKKFDEIGEYENKSKYIYIVPSADLASGEVPDTALPWGFTGYETFPSGTFSNAAGFPDLPFVYKTSYKSDFNTKVYWGIEVVNNASGSLNFGLLDRVKHLPNALSTASGSVGRVSGSGGGQRFSLKWISASVQSATGYTNTVRLTDTMVASLSTSLSFSVNTQTSPVVSGSGGYTGYLSVANLENTNLAKFTMVMTDGFDGLDVTKTNPYDPSDMAATTTYQTYGYRTGLDMLSNGDVVEISELAMPGVWADKVVSYAIDMVEARGDTFYMADISGSSVGDVKDALASTLWDSSYAGVWYPWLKLRDEVHNKLVSVPPTVVMPAVLAYNDSVSFAWYAPAGMTRGGLKKHGVASAKDKLTKAERDTLYENRINPIGTFPGEGVVVWGQKTLQQAASALDRISVRRMLLQTRKLISKKALGIVFEPNVPAVWARFKNSVTPDLERIQQNFGISDFKLILDERTTTEDLISRNIMYGKIAIKPTPTAEFILLDFFVTNNVAGFEI